MELIPSKRSSSAPLVCFYPLDLRRWVDLNTGEPVVMWGFTSGLSTERSHAVLAEMPLCVEWDSAASCETWGGWICPWARTVPARGRVTFPRCVYVFGDVERRGLNNRSLLWYFVGYGDRMSSGRTFACEIYRQAAGYLLFWMYCQATDDPLVSVK